MDIVGKVLPAAVLTALGQPEGAALLTAEGEAATTAGILGTTGEIGSTLATTAGGLGALSGAGTGILGLTGADLASNIAESSLGNAIPGAAAITEGANAAAGIPMTATGATSAFSDAANAANIGQFSGRAVTAPSMLGSDIGSFTGEVAPYTGGISNIAQAPVTDVTGNLALNPQASGVGVDLTNQANLQAGQGISMDAMKQAGVDYAVPTVDTTVPYAGPDYMGQGAGVVDDFTKGTQQGTGLWDTITGKWNSLTPFEKMGAQIGGGMLFSSLTKPEAAPIPPKKTYESKPIDPTKRTAPTPPTNPIQATYPDYALHPYTMAEGGIASLAPGGLTQNTPNQNIGVNPNQMYPQSQQEHTYFATPTQMPTSAEVVDAGYEPKTDPYTGTMSMAEGGIARYATGGTPVTGYATYYDPQKQQYYYVDPSKQNSSNPLGTNPMMSLMFPGIIANVLDAQRTYIGNPFARTDTPAPNTAIYQQSYENTVSPTYNPSAGTITPTVAPNASTTPSLPPGIPTSADVANYAAQVNALGNRFMPKPDVEKKAQGGVVGYAFGGGINEETAHPQDEYSIFRKVHDTLDPRNKAKNFATKAADVGIYHETDQDFANTDAYNTALGRQEKINKRIGMPNQPSALKAVAPLGVVDMTPATIKYQEALALAKKAASENMAHGGIAGYSLGGYAAGGNPRLLKGPGDGMSDNIPATIADRQPARLADGEFVVPADVVSHLGNGSTDAGAKKLHHMMDKVRVARTGKKKQGTQINPDKFLPA